MFHAEGTLEHSRARSAGSSAGGRSVRARCPGPRFSTTDRAGGSSAPCSSPASDPAPCSETSQKPSLPSQPSRQLASRLSCPSLGTSSFTFQPQLGSRGACVLPAAAASWLKARCGSLPVGCPGWFHCQQSLFFLPSLLLCSQPVQLPV